MAQMRFSPQFDSVDALLALQRELSGTFDRPLGLDLGPSGRGVYPAVNVFTDREGYVLRLEVPGVAPEDLEIDRDRRPLLLLFFDTERDLQIRLDYINIYFA